MPTSKEILQQYADAHIEATEGGSCEEQIDYFLKFLSDHTDIKVVFEIGFNGGLSAATFLSARSDIQVVSVDIGRYAYVLKAKEWIDRDFPGRHTLIIGNSMTAVPNILSLFKSFSPDLIFIDGGHDAPVPKADLENCIKMARDDTWLVMDDVVPWMIDILTPLNKMIQDETILAHDFERHDIHGWLLFQKNTTASK